LAGWQASAGRPSLAGWQASAGRPSLADWQASAGRPSLVDWQALVSLDHTLRLRLVYILCRRSSMLLREGFLSLLCRYLARLMIVRLLFSLLRLHFVTVRNLVAEYQHLVMRLARLSYNTSSKRRTLT
jgi:hypothetical protein